MMMSAQLIDPETGLTLTRWGSWLLLILGVVKLLIWLIGERWPSLYKRVKSQTIRNLFTGKTNRMVFGCGGFVTALLGVIFLIMAAILARLMANS